MLEKSYRSLSAGNLTPGESRGIIIAKIATEE